MRQAIIGMAMLAACVAVPARAAVTDKGCAWIVEPTADRENVLFPEVTTRYLAAIAPALPAGGYVEVTGEFPHARYMSLQTYSSTLQTISNIHDEEILPDAGSGNPYMAGALRSAAQRSYTVRVLDAPVPAAGQEPNTLYYQSADGMRSGRNLVYRIYLPDRGMQPFGGVAAPTLTEVLPGGIRIPIPTCPDPVPDTTFLEAELAAAGGSDYPLPPAGLVARAVPEWHKYLNAGTSYADMLTNDEILGPLNPPLRALAAMLPAGLGENADNKYVYTGLSREFGGVVVFRAQLPTTPRTYDAEPAMGVGQLRFWSMCTGNRSTQTYDCLVDKDMPLNAGGVFTVAISPAALRPANARPECGVGWLPWGPDVSGTVIMRNMLPAAGFANSVQSAEQGTEAQTLGPYYPAGTYYATPEDFEAAVGCQAPAAFQNAGAAPLESGGALDPRMLLLLFPAGAAFRKRLHRPA
jgi:hypothetical protein